MKVALLADRIPEWRRDHQVRLRCSLPFAERDGFGYVHRVRSANMHYDGPVGSASKHTHTAIYFWCGGSGFLSMPERRQRNRLPMRLVESPSAGLVICATCEARAIGSGQLGSRMIAGRFVKFSPRAPFFNDPQIGTHQ